MIIYLVIHLICTLLSIFLMANHFKYVSIQMIGACLILGPVALITHLAMTDDLVIWRKKK